MATLEDKILGEKLHCYCSSSESDGEKSGDDDGEDGARCVVPSDVQPPSPYKWGGSSTNTGPKGVVQDWQRYKQLQNEMRAEQEKEKLALIQKLSLTCKSALDEEKDAKSAGNEIDAELAELLNDEFLLEYQKKRMQEMMSHIDTMPKFGSVLNLPDSQAFLDAIDNENKDVTVIVHIYEDEAPGCEAMNGCLISLCQEYSQVKFCKIIGSNAGVSKKFKIGGVPALLVYKGGQMIGNFVRVSQELGEDFYAEDVESFLLEHGILPDKSCIPSIIRASAKVDNYDSDLSLE